jgi:hypothetical protein
MLMKSTSLEWLALCFVNCVRGVGSTQTYLTDFCRLDDVPHWQQDFHHCFDFFVQKSRTILTLR